MKKLFENKKRAFISIIAVVVVVLVFVNVCASAFYLFAIFKKDGWE